MPEFADLNRTLVDTAYVTIGWSLLGFQRAQVRRRELGHQLEELARAVDMAVAPLRVDLNRRVDGLEDRLPDQARLAVRSLREVAKLPEQLLRAQPSHPSTES
ncbi:MAG TPA: hypothetical protein VG184_03070 [Acidimicrobiales bacterium]|nr:hypothetical protein [Acidimicrobiales bacterium]